MSLELKEGLPSELAILQELQKVSVQLISGGNDKLLHNQLMRTAMTLLNADFASMQLYRPLSNE